MSKVILQWLVVLITVYGLLVGEPVGALGLIILIRLGCLDGMVQGLVGKDNHRGEE